MSSCPLLRVAAARLSTRSHAPASASRSPIASMGALAQALALSGHSNDNHQLKQQPQSSTSFLQLPPRLPLPSLNDTADRYLESIQPFLKDKPDHVKEVTVQKVKLFMKQGNGIDSGPGERAQARLMKLAKEKPSWLEDIWLRCAYLKRREPSLINVNWWSQIANHPQHPKSTAKRLALSGFFTEFQVTRAAGLISSMLAFKRLLDSGTLPVDISSSTGNPLCMNQYKNLFGTCRVPGEKEDTMYGVTNASGDAGTMDKQHIVVMARDQIYSVPVVRSDGTQATLRDLETSLYAVTRDSLSSQIQQDQEPQQLQHAEPSIGLLTAGHRQNWAQAHSRLRQLSAQNVRNLEIIQSSLFVLALDDKAESARGKASVHQMFFHRGDARNRWFDKTLQLIVASDGKAGMNGEHTALDAVVAGRLMDFLCTSEPVADPEKAPLPGSLPPPTKLKWIVDDAVEKHISAAETTAKELIQDTYSLILSFNVFGSKYIKEVAKTSPDAFVQLALQLAWVRLHSNSDKSTPIAVYESCSTREFHHGRTETCRSLSTPSHAFTTIFDDDDILYETKRAAFRTAADHHVALLRAARSGAGVDRHLLGLRAVLEEEGVVLKEEEDIFQDPVFSESTTFRLSTSNIGTGKNWIAGFGPAEMDGYGVAYAIDKYGIELSISAKKSTMTSAPRFREYVERALMDLMVLFPKRSSVWGPRWERIQQQERKEEVFLNTMKKLGNEFFQHKQEIENKYTKGHKN